MLQSQDIQAFFNETIRSVNDTASRQYLRTLSDINATQADIGTYDITAYGLRSVHDIQSAVIGPVSTLTPLSGQAPAPVIAPDANGPVGGLISSLNTMFPVHNIQYALLLITLCAIIGRVVFYKKKR